MAAGTAVDAVVMVAMVDAVAEAAEDIIMVAEEVTVDAVIMDGAITAAATGAVVTGEALGLMLIMRGAHPTTLTTAVGVQVLA